MKIELAPSILGGDPSNLFEAVKQIKDAGLKWVHVDIMDGHFVPNLTFGPHTVKRLKSLFPEMFFDVHLMLDNPNLYIEAFADAGSDLISIHVEPEYPIDATLTEIHLAKKQSGITINPMTPVLDVIPFLPKVNLVLVMSVQPGFGGQVFKEDALEKIATLKRIRAEMNLNFVIEVDGGITACNIEKCIEAGADVIVAGTEFYKNRDKLLTVLENH